MPSTTFCIWPSSKRFEQNEANYFNFSPLFVLFMFFSFLCYLVITLLHEICLSSFHPWAHIKVTSLLGLFLCSFIFVFCVVFQTFFLHVFFLGWWHPYFQPYPCYSPCFESFCLPIGLYEVGCLSSQVFGWAPSSLPLKFTLLTKFYCLIDDINILGFLFGSNSFSSSFL